MPMGTVKWYNQAKRFGFITPDEGQDDVFVHVTAVEAAGIQILNTGQRVSYELGATHNGRVSASDLKLAD